MHEPNWGLRHLMHTLVSVNKISLSNGKMKKLQSLKSVLIRGRNSISHERRKLCTIANSDLPNYLDEQVLVEGKNYSRTAILNRPSVLNALNTAIGARLQKLYRTWEDDPDIGFVMMKGSGRAFCAGGDIVSLYHLINEGKIEQCKEFFRMLYTFIYHLGTYLKPHVALLNGITMGGGGGVSIPGTFRVATDKTVFATPETLIGFHPDAGASFYLPRLPGYMGEYLALTGGKLNGVEMLACGLATHYCDTSKVPLMEGHLGKLGTDDPSVVETSLDKFADVVYPDRTTIINRINIIDECFSLDTVEEMVDALENEAAKTNDTWCISTLKNLKEASPLSLKVSLRSIREGRFQSLDQCLVREYRMSLQGISKQVPDNFCEGVRSKLVEKDRAPKWEPPRLELVSNDMVDQYFRPLNELEPELELPTQVREAFA